MIRCILSRTLLCAAFVVLAIATSARAVPLVFTIDPAGTATGLSGIAPISANRGNYQSGSWLALSGTMSATIQGITASGPFVNQQNASGSFSSGNPGSLLDFFSGNLNVNLDTSLNTISLPGGSAINGTNYNANYAENPLAPAVNLAPAVGGGTSGGPAGSGPADLGATASLTALFGLIRAPTTAAFRNVVGDLKDMAAPVPLSPSGPIQTFPTNGLFGFATTAGNFDFNTIDSGANSAGTTSIATTQYTPTTAGNGTLTTTTLGGSTLYTLSIPIQVTVTTAFTSGVGPETITTTYSGSIAAYAVVPEPATLTLVGMGLVSLVPVGMRRWRCNRSG